MDKLIEVRDLKVAFRLVLEHPWHQQVAVLHALLRFPLEQPLSPAEPSAGACHLAPPGAVGANPECAANGAPRLARFEV